MSLLLPYVRKHFVHKRRYMSVYMSPRLGLQVLKLRSNMSIYPIHTHTYIYIEMDLTNFIKSHFVYKELYNGALAHFTKRISMFQ